MDFSEKWGTNIENAVELALIDLKLTRDQVEVIVLEEPSKGFFGIGSKLAKVRVERKKEEKQIKEEVKKEEILEKPIIKKANEKRSFERDDNKQKIQDRKFNSFKSEENTAFKEDKKQTKETRYKKVESNFEGLNNEKPDNLVNVAEDNKVLIFLKELTEQMGLEVSIEAKENEDIIFVDMEGKDSGTIIGKRGQTLDAIQYLTSLVANKGDGKYIKVVVDAENYRQKREKTLEQLANRLSSKVIKSRKSVRLEPMNPYERKVIHATLQSNPEVTTRSEGEEPYRRVIIDLK